jgi:hypothetical protein
MENTSTTSIDFAKIERARRKEHEKIEQVNMMYRTAKELGFPEQVQLELKHSHYVIVSIPNCFDGEDYYYEKSPTFFIRVRIKSLLFGYSCGEVFEEDGSLGVPNFVMWLLICMKLFYKKDWDGKQWIDQKDAFRYQQESFKYQEMFSVPTSTYSEMANVSDIQSKVVKQLAEKMALELDDKIIKAVKENSNDWKVQVGNVIYQPKKWLGDIGI